jgi:hypothetical protein
LSSSRASCSSGPLVVRVRGAAPRRARDLCAVVYVALDGRHGLRSLGLITRRLDAVSPLEVGFGRATGDQTGWCRARPTRGRRSGLRGRQRRARLEHLPLTEVLCGPRSLYSKALVQTSKRLQCCVVIDRLLP